MPTATLTKRTCDAAKPQGATFTLWDSDIPGFGLRVTPNVSKTFVLKYRDQKSGRQHWHSIGRFGSDTTAERARGIAEQLRSAIRHDGANPARDRRDRLNASTIAELADAYIRERPQATAKAKKERSWATDESNIRAHIKPAIGHIRINALTQRDVRDFQNHVRQGGTARVVQPDQNEPRRPRSRTVVRGGPGIANRSVAVLSAMLNWAVSRGLLEQNPAAGVKQIKTGVVRRNMEDHELLKLATAMEQWQAEAELQPEPFRPAAVKARRTWIAALRLLLLTGARKNEILALRKDEFDEDARRLRLRDSKTGAKSIPLPATALAILKQVIDEAPSDSLWVFPSVRGDGPMSGLQKVWTTICSKAGVTGVTIHSLRHTFASAAVNGGGSIYLASKVLGHADIKTTQGYSHADDDAVLSLAERTAELLASRLRVIEGGKAHAA